MAEILRSVCSWSPRSVPHHLHLRRLPPYFASCSLIPDSSAQKFHEMADTTFSDEEDMEEVLGMDPLQPGDIIVEVRDETTVLGSLNGTARGKGKGGRKLDDAFVRSALPLAVSAVSPNLILN